MEYGIWNTGDWLTMLPVNVNVWVTGVSNVDSLVNSAGYATEDANPAKRLAVFHDSDENIVLAF